MPSQTHNLLFEGKKNKFSEPFQFSSSLVISPVLLFNILQTQNCSQEGDYGRQKSPHYHQIIQTDLTLCKQNYHKNQNVLKRTSKYDIVDTQPPAWGLCC